MVRPMALAGPVLILIIALPLLRPLRHPEAASNDEILRIASIRALVEHRSLQLDKSYAKVPGTIKLETGVYSPQPPMMAVLLWGPAWTLTQMGVSFDEHHVLMEYLLIVIGVTLPVAGAAGLVYRMGRLFELRRPWRTLLGFCVVAGSGLLTYSVVLNPYAPAAVLVIAAAACLIHVAAMNRDDRRAGWFALAGACGALATTLDPAAVLILFLFMFAIPAMRFSIGRRIAGMLLYLIGATPVLAMHVAWNTPVTGDEIPASVHSFFRTRTTIAPAYPVVDEFSDDESAGRSFWDMVGANVTWFATATVGSHGVLSHFPVLILGIFGIGAVMHRHWPSSTKMLAGASGVAALAYLIIYRTGRAEWMHAMFACKWFVTFSPILLFWTGAWLRRSHSTRSWVLAGTALGFSLIVGVIGATGPMPREGFDNFTAVDAVRRLFHTAHEEPPSNPAISALPAPSAR